MKQWKKIVTYVSVGTYFIIANYFIFDPIRRKYFHTIAIHDLHTLSEARNYYTVLSSITGIMTGFLGLILGYVYFVKRNEYDNNNNLLNRRRGRIHLIIEQLNKYDEYVDEIVSLRVKNDNDLKSCRSKLERYFEIVAVIIEKNEQLLNFEYHEIQTVMQVNSFVEQNQPIMELSYNLLSKMDLKEIRSNYIDKIQDARRVCYLKSE